MTSGSNRILCYLRNVIIDEDKSDVVIESWHFSSLLKDFLAKKSQKMSSISSSILVWLSIALFLGILVSWRDVTRGRFCCPKPISPRPQTNQAIFLSVWVLAFTQILFAQGDKRGMKFTSLSFLFLAFSLSRDEIGTCFLVWFPV